MPRIEKAFAAERETFAVNFFKSNPSLSIAKMNAALESKFGSKMRAKRAYELREVAQNQVASPAASTAAAGRRNGKRVAKVVAIRSQPKAERKPVRKVRQEAARINTELADASGAPTTALAVVRGNKEQLDWFQGALRVMRDGNVSQARIDHRTSDYAIVVA